MIRLRRWITGCRGRFCSQSSNRFTPLLGAEEGNPPTLRDCEKQNSGGHGQPLKERHASDDPIGSVGVMGPEPACGLVLDLLDRFEQILGKPRRQGKGTLVPG